LNNKPTNILDSLRSGGDVALNVYQMLFIIIKMKLELLWQPPSLWNISLWVIYLG